MFTKEESLENFITLITRGGDDKDFYSMYPYFKYEIDYIFKLIEEHFALLQLFGLNQDYEKVIVKDKDKLNKSFQKNCVELQKCLDETNKDRVKHLKTEVERLQKELKYIEEKKLKKEVEHLKIINELQFTKENLLTTNQLDTKGMAVILGALIYLIRGDDDQLE